ncbi:MAG: hypothetical protein JWM21_4520 [Acidobacteria bacterium]|nr:hypothetical protein [Acidobacteriota bacterium]
MRLIGLLLLFASVLVFAPVPKTHGEEVASIAAAKLLPDRIGGFVAYGASRPAAFFRSGAFNETGEATREYLAVTGERLSITLVSTKSDSSAYALLTSKVGSYPKSAAAAGADPQILKSGAVGTASYLFRDCLFFYKGPVYVVVGQMGEKGKHLAPIEPLARGFAELLDKGEGELPALVKHLPDIPGAPQNVRYAVNAESLTDILPDQTVTQSIGFEGGTEVVTASYGSSQLAIAEFTTPQLASENDWNIGVKIRELWSQGKPAPTAYRRVGNYAVFVFNAPNDQSANQLIDQVKYEQVVQWLGDNPNWLKDAQRQYTETTLGVFVSVVKASGVAALVCFGIGGLVGGLLFARRRAQQTTAEAYSDAGGMMRLNLDELSAEPSAARLIGSKSSDKL